MSEIHIQISDSNLYDQSGIPIERGDLVKVFHFTGARRKRHYMYKQALGVFMMGEPTPIPFMKFSHLNLNDAEYYWERCNGEMLPQYEIVQSIVCDHEERRQRKEVAV